MKELSEITEKQSIYSKKNIHIFWIAFALFIIAGWLCIYSKGNVTITLVLMILGFFIGFLLAKFNEANK